MGTQGEDPTEPRRSGAYPYSAISHEPRIQQLSEDFAAHGLKPFHTPLGVMLGRGESAEESVHPLQHLRRLSLSREREGGRADLLRRPALAYPNVTLLTDTKVMRLHTSPSGREVTAVEVERNGQKETYSGSIVVVSGGAINSAALLLRSANDKHPNGLANGSDVVGRHYMGHVNSVLMALSKCPNPTVFQKTLSVNDFYFGSPEWDFPMGHISFVGKLDGDTLKAGHRRWRRSGRWI